MPRREAPAHALPPDYEGQIDLFVVLSVQRFGLDWPAIVNQIKTTLTIERGLIDALPSFPSAARCEDRWRLATQHVNGDKMAALPGIIADMVAKRLQTLANAHASVSHEVSELRKLLGDTVPAPPVVEAPAAPAATSATPGEAGPSGVAPDAGAADGTPGAAQEGEDPDVKPATGRTRTTGPTDTSVMPGGELDEKWGDIAEEEASNTRRKSDGSGIFLKLLQSVTKHKWAHPFKRPVTDKEAPDYKEIVKNPMDLSTLRKKVDTNAVPDVQSLVNDLVLIFENAMLYNAKASDYHKMADTLRKQVHAQHEHYQRWKREHDKKLAEKAANAPDEPADAPDDAADAADAAEAEPAEASEAAPAEEAEVKAEAPEPEPEPEKEPEKEPEAAAPGRSRKRSAAAVEAAAAPTPSGTGTGRRKTARKS